MTQEVIIHSVTPPELQVTPEGGLIEKPWTVTYIVIPDIENITGTIKFAPEL